MMKERLIYVKNYIKRPISQISTKMCMCDLGHVSLY